MGELLYGKTKADAVAKKLIVNRYKSQYPSEWKKKPFSIQACMEAVMNGDLDADGSTPTVSKKRRKLSAGEDPFGKSILKLKKRKTLVRETDMFNIIVWPVLLRLGWTIEHGARQNDKYYVRPGFSCSKNTIKNQHYFDSRKSLLESISIEAFSSNDEEIKNCLEEYYALYIRGPDIIAMGNIPREGYTPSVLAKVLKKNPFLPETPLFDHIILPELRRLGWTTEEVAYGSDTLNYYLPPYVARNKNHSKVRP